MKKDKWFHENYVQELLPLAPEQVLILISADMAHMINTILASVDMLIDEREREPGIEDRAEILRTIKSPARDTNEILQAVRIYTDQSRDGKLAT